MTKPAVVELKNIKKHFGPVKANDGVDLSVYAGEVHAILGENGSGKSTLMNILSGLYAPDGGEIILEGESVVFHSPKDAMDNGIGMIHQHFKLVEALTAWENIAGGMKKGFFVKKFEVVRDVMKLCEKYKLHIDATKKVYDMTIGEKQTVEIVKALYRGAKVLILDEPTAVLTTQETEKLFNILKEMKKNGCAVIIITHKLQEVMDVSDRVTVLRKGVSEESLMTADSNAHHLAELMVGREIDITVPYVDTSDKEKKPVLSIRDLKISVKGVDKLNIPSLDINSYEILGIAGVADSGQKELAESITGMQKATGSVKLHDTELIGMDPKAMDKKGIKIGFVPEDRLGMGLASGLSISDNVALRTYKTSKGILLNKKQEQKDAEALIEQYDVSAAGVNQQIQMLSGGNIQKILLGREINRGTDFLIAAYPVRGLDIGASDFIYEQMNKQKEQGVAIMFIGEDLDMLLGICDRIAVLHAGELMGVVDAKATDKEKLGLLMMGEKLEVNDEN